MTVAVRVLHALNMKDAPRREDVEELRRLDPLLADTAELDELACEVIRRALKRRAEVREKQERTGSP